MTIRRQPSDFVVQEIPGDHLRLAWRTKPDSRHPFALLTLQKTSLTTPEATLALARELKVSPGSVQHAGFKDKHAQTEQFVTVAVPSPASLGDRSQWAGKHWIATLVGWSAAPAEAAWIERNCFTIVIRDLTLSSSQAMDERVRWLLGEDRDGAASDRSVLFTNYFGDQRFGSARHGEGFAALHLMRGDFEAALKLLIATPARKDTGSRREFTRLCAQHWGRWNELARSIPKLPEARAIQALASVSADDAAPRGPAHFREAFAALPNFLQQLSVDAYQSHLWNETARRCVVAMAGTDYWVTKDDFGDMLFADPRRISPEWERVELPAFSPETFLEAPWKPQAVEVLAELGLTLDAFTIPGLRRPRFGAARRPLLARAEHFTLDDAQPDELAPPRGKKAPPRFKRTARFDLPRGCYATVVLRALGS